MIATINAQEFASMLKAVLPHASKDKMLPLLRSVHVKVESPFVKAYATDRYTAAESLGHMVELHDVEFSFTLSADDAKRLISTYGKLRHVLVSFDHYGGELTITDDVGGRTVFQTVEGDWPPVERLIHGPIQGEPESTFALKVANLERFAVRHLARTDAERHAPLRFHHGAQNKPVRVEFSDHFAALLMPVRDGSGER